MSNYEGINSFYFCGTDPPSFAFHFGDYNSDLSNPNYIIQFVLGQSPGGVLIRLRYE
jgi:hypothetical protein